MQGGQHTQEGEVALTLREKTTSDVLMVLAMVVAW